MQRLGIETGADLKAKSHAFLNEHFGKAGGWYYRIARGIDERPVVPDRTRKSIGAEDTFATDIFDLETALSEIKALVAKVWQHCEAKGARRRTVTLKVKFAYFQQITRSRPPAHRMNLRDVEQIAPGLLQPVFPVQKGIRLLGVTLSSLDGGPTS